MKLTLDMNAKDRLEAFLTWLQGRAEDKTHENNADVIADFVEKVIIVELKRLENTLETFEQEVEVPDDVMTQPLMTMKGAMDKAFNDFLVSKGMTAAPAAPQSGDPAPAATAPAATAPAATAPAATAPAAASAPRNGNGHATTWKRKLNDNEKNYIHGEFLKLNGEFEDAKKSCTAMLPRMGAEISVWQITGFVSYLHREIAANRSQVGDMDVYMKFLKNHKKLWAQYNSSKYAALRKVNPVDPVIIPITFPKKTA